LTLEFRSAVNLRGEWALIRTDLERALNTLPEDASREFWCALGEQLRRYSSQTERLATASHRGGFSIDSYFDYG